MTFDRDSHQNFELKRTGIYKAIEEGNLERVRKFIAEGIDLEQRDKYAATPLILAVQVGSLDIVKELLKAGALPVYTEGYLLINAMRLHDLAILAALIEANIDVDQRLEDNDTALIRASYRGNFEVVKMLVEAGADVNAINKHGDFALLAAARNVWLEIFQFLAPLTSPELRTIAEKELRTVSRSQRKKRRPT